MLLCYCCALVSQLLPITKVVKGRIRGTVYDALLSTAAAPKHTHTFAAVGLLEPSLAYPRSCAGCRVQSEAP